METDKERKARLEKVVSTKLLRLAMETDDEKKSKTGEDGSSHTAQVGAGDRGRKKSKFNLDLIRIEIGIFKNKIFKE